MLLPVLVDKEPRLAEFIIVEAGPFKSLARFCAAPDVVVVPVPVPANPANPAVVDDVGGGEGENEIGRWGDRDAKAEG